MKLVICGGGISGLSAAFYASQFFSRNGVNCSITLLEKSPNVGGWMKTNVKNGDRNEYDGPIYELGPRSVRTAGLVGNNTLQFVSDLGLKDRLISVKSTDVAAKNRLIYAKKQLHLLPASILSAITTKPPFSKSLAQSFVSGYFSKISSKYETMHEVTAARFGEEVADYLISSFCRGVYAADSKQLSMKAAFPLMWKRLKPKEATMPKKPDLERPDTLGKVLLTNPFIKWTKRERWTQWATIDGFQSFVESIADHLVNDMGVDILRNAEVNSITICDTNKVSLGLNSTGLSSLPANKIDDIDHVVFALPSYVVSKVFRRPQPLANKNTGKLNNIGKKLSQIQWVDVAVVNIEYSGKPADLLPVVGFGHLVPSSETSNVLGIVYDSCAFPSHDRLGKPTVRLTCMMGGSWFEDLFGDPYNVDTKKLEKAALQSVAKQLNITKDPKEIHTTMCTQCIPMYSVGHTDVVEETESYIEENDLPLSLVGASYWGPSINDCIYNSRVAIYNMLTNIGFQI